MPPAEDKEITCGVVVSHIHKYSVSDVYSIMEVKYDNIGWDRGREQGSKAPSLLST